MAIKAILFDKDGTLIDVNGTWVPFYRHMLAQEFQCGPVETERLMVAAGYDPASNGFHAGSLMASGTTLQMVEVWWPDASPEKQRETGARLDRDYAPLARKFLKPLLDLPPILSALQGQGHVLGVGTNDSEISARGHMDALGVSEFFIDIIGWDSVPVPKPSGNMVRKFAALAGVKPEEVAMVGDNTHDIEEARNGGAGLAIAVLTGNGAREHVEEHADHVLASVAELPGFLARL